MNVAVKAPMELVVAVATVVDPKVIVTVEVGVKLVPETVTDVATTPEFGLSDIPGINWYVEEAMWEEVSVEVTLWVPSVETGAMRVAVNEPVMSVEELPIVVKSNATIIEEEPEKPVPVTVKEDPDTPTAGVTVVDAITVYCVVAVFADVSSARTVFPPFVDAGMLNVALNEPVTVEVTTPGVVTTIVPSYFTVIVDDAAKPVPEIVIVEPTVPLDELSVIEETMLKLEVAELEDASVATTV